MLHSAELVPSRVRESALVALENAIGIATELTSNNQSNRQRPATARGQHQALASSRQGDGSTGAHQHNQQPPPPPNGLSNTNQLTNGQANSSSTSPATAMARKLSLARAKSISGKLLDSHGAELRRTLFSLRQIFQEDAELAIAFLEANGFDCLLKVAKDADQIHQNYILRAIGQLTTHPSGMELLLRHNETIQWLYKLLASQHQIVAKSSLKLLLSFIERNEPKSACEQLCKAVGTIDKCKGSIYWSNIINLLENLNANNHHLTQNSQQLDTETLTNCITLVTRILVHLPTELKDTHQQLIDTLKQLNLSQTTMDKYLDLDSHLRKQFKLYEKKLASAEEDEDDDDDDDQTHNKSDETVTSDRNEVGDEDAQAGSYFNQRQTHPKRASTSRQPASQSELSNGNESDDHVGGPTQNDDNDYESANDDLTHEDKLRSNNPTSSDPTKDACLRIADRLVQTVNEDNQEHSSQQNRRHQLHLRSQPPPQHQRSSIQIKPQNNLARGKQQRASISSCSSSDSYASYGSGYASGSGNSTDHEHKQQAQQQQEQPSPHLNPQSQEQNHRATPNLSSDNRCASVLNALTDGIDNLSVRSVARSAKTRNDIDSNAEEGAKASNEDVESDADNAVVDEKGERDDADQDSQLKQHLSELEQLTDELAKRDRYSSIKQPAQSTNKHFSTNLKSDSTNANKALSVDSNNSSFSSGINSAMSVQSALTTSIYQIKQQAANISNGSASADADSRSASATPTSCLQQADTSNPASSQLSLSPGRQCKQVSSDKPDEPVHRDSSRPANQYTMLSTANNNSPFRGMQHGKTPVITPSPNKTQSQEPYYHNLFQWEQLVSKGVTRPLLINDLDFTDLRDEDDCDLLTGNSHQAVNASRRNVPGGEPLTISIPPTQVQANLDHDSVDSGASTGSPGSRSVNEKSGTPASAPPPLPPPPISPWFNTLSGSRPQSQFMSSPSPPPFDFGGSNGNRDQSPVASTYSNYSRNSVCVAQQPTGTQHSNTLQPVGSLRSASSMSSLLFGNNGKYGSKRKKTMKLFWKEVREDRSLLAKLTKKKTIWDEIKPVPIDTQKLEYLFESKAKDLSLSKSRTGLDGMSQRKVKITVLDAKRSNAINIGMTKLPPMRTIKSAILKMDSSIMNREGIEKILTTMMPTEEEKSRIIEAQLANPDTPLGTAEQFLLNLASISALEARLKLWAFQLDYAQIEKEVAEPLMDLKQAIDEIERSETFRNILGTLLSIGNFLNSTNVKGFQIDYLEKVPEVKDTVHKHSLLHHLCLFIQEKFDPDLSSDLYSEFSAVNRASKVDYTEVAKNLKKMQQDCKASWDHLKIVAKHDGLANLMNPCSAPSQSANNDSSLGQHQPKSSGKLNNLSKLSMITTVIGSDSNSNDQQAPTTKQIKMKVSDFLTDCAERIMVLVVIHRRVMNRFQKLLVYLGCPSHQIKQTQPQQILKIINEFALEYRTKRERVREMLLRKQQCQHHHTHGNRWQLNRTRWAGSQQCIDNLGYNNRPCSTASSIASSSYTTNNLNCPDCALSARQRSMEPHHHANQHGANHRPGSPSALSQISNYSDYLLDQSCYSRQESMTPVASVDGMGRRPHSMSISMFDLQQRQHHQINNGNPSDANALEVPTNNRISENELARQKDEQMRRILGGGKSFDGACHDLYQMSHWTSTMARVPSRHPTASHKQRASSIDCTGKIDNPENDNSFDASFGTNGSVSPKRQSSYYRYLHSNANGYNCSMDDEQNSDEEILQSLVRTVTAKSGQQNGSHSSNRSSISGKLNDSTNSNDSATSTRSTKSKILSRFNCDRKSLRRDLRPSLESNA